MVRSPEEELAHGTTSCSPLQTQGKACALPSPTGSGPLHHPSSRKDLLVQHRPQPKRSCHDSANENPPLLVSSQGLWSKVALPLAPFPLHKPTVSFALHTCPRLPRACLFCTAAPLLFLNKPILLVFSRWTDLKLIFVCRRNHKLQPWVMPLLWGSALSKY